MPCLAGPLQGKGHAGQKVGHESIALSQKSCRYSCPVQASEQALQACLLYPHLVEPRSSRMQVPLGEQAWECSALAQFLSSRFFQVLATVFGGDSKSISLIICSATCSMPWPVLQFTRTYGLSPLTSFASLSIIARSAPTWGARSILFMTKRSHVSIPKPLFLGYLSPPDTSIM